MELRTHTHTQTVTSWIFNVLSTTQDCFRTTNRQTHRQTDTQTDGHRHRNQLNRVHRQSLTSDLWHEGGVGVVGVGRVGLPHGRGDGGSQR